MNTGAFQRFASLYQRYQQSLPQAVAAWQHINNRVNLASVAMRSFNATSAAASSSWRTIASHTANVASSLKSATDSLLRWTSISSIVGGLLGIGSLFGLDRLALGVGAGRREATGVGTTYGQQTAFNLSYGRFVDPGILSRITDVASGPQSWILRNLGASREALTSGNSVDIARQILPALQKFAKEAPTNQLGLRAHAFQYDKVITLEELNRLKFLGGELREQDPKYKARLAAFTRTGTTEKDYQDFSDKLEEAGETIKNVFVTGLQPVIPKLTDLSGALTNVLVRFLHEIKPSDIQLLADKIGELATYLGSPEFKEKLDRFINGMEELGDTLLKWGEKLHIITPASSQYENITSHRKTREEALAEHKNKYGFFAPLVPMITMEGDRTPNKPLGVPSVFGSVNNPRNLPVGGFARSDWETTSDFYQYGTKNVGQDLTKIKNMTDRSVYLTITSPAGSATPQATAMIGAAGAGFGR